MDTRALYRHMSHYHLWRQDLSQRLRRFEHWVQTHGLVSDEVRQCLAQARQLLGNNDFTLVCVGEFSRGKTELINALLMDERKQRILPSHPGRTTMCPTEIHCDPDRPNCLRLLPIETRRSQASLERFKRIPRNWVTLSLDPKTPETLRATLDQVSASQWVSEEDARQLGFSPDQNSERNEEGLVAIPRWRHAMISLEHPLLRRGLRIIDTPGLNALGNEPELTLRVLPQAQAIVFLLSADAGLTASDMKLWRDHIRSLSQQRGSAVLTLLNKVDSLWDDLQPPEQVAQAVDELRLLTARQLAIEPEQVLPLSAKQALLGRARDDAERLERSGFRQLEQALGQTVARSRQALAGQRLITDSQAMIDNVYHSLKGRLADARQELLLLRAGEEQDNEALLSERREAIRQKHRQYHKQSLSLRTSQMLLDKQRPSLIQVISPERLAREIDHTRQRLANSWTTVGLSRSMAHLFDWLDHQLGHLEREVERTNRVLDSIYQRPEHAIDASQRPQNYQLDLTDERRQLRQLHHQADQFRASLDSLLSLKGPLIQRFVGTLVQEARALWHELYNTIDHWLKQALVPLFQHNQYQRQLLEHHMLRLTRMRHERQSQAQQVDSLHQNIKQMERALEDLLAVRERAQSEAEPERLAPVVPLSRARTAQPAS
ncbi:dynamin family protein [Marinimicrobium sp. C6131]|uniref:dynamin family protein n=1 Tax=Marinimicrobium sp. C6131 TaxID=3022676 RepID=UPI00223D54EB|nr:dynamin family protein [Marinimicrobium sp. C6131]UZJ43349.1 dynamin family protein [Marinimicrobium sp. C6131]